MESATITTPVAQKQRISIIDTIRGMAVLGILMMNIPYFSDYYLLADNPFINKETGKDLYTWIVVNGAFEGTMRALFSLLFGAGTVLLLSRLEANPTPGITPADIYYRRLLWLLLFGLFNAFVLTWPGDILYTYSICGLFLYPFRNMKPRGLILMGLLMMVIFTVKSSWSIHGDHETRIKGEELVRLKQQGKVLSAEDSATAKKWEDVLASRNPEKLAKEIEEGRAHYRKGYAKVFVMSSGYNAKIQSKEFYHELFFDALGLFFIGMALFKLGIITGKRSRRFYWIFMLLNFLVGFGLSYHELSKLMSVKMDNYWYWEKVGPDLYQFRRLAQALGYMSLVLLLNSYGLLTKLWHWLSKVGQMAFTNYLMQQMICGFIFYWGLKKFGTLARHETYYVVFGIWIFQIIFSNIWLHYFRFGPFEWLWRSLTYWKKQPMRKANARAADMI